MLQDNWRWCHKCQGLFFAGNPTQGTCSAGNTHENRGSGNYSLLLDSPVLVFGQGNWRWCHKCQGLFFAGNPTQGNCPAGGAHENRGSGDYTLYHNAPAFAGQSNWRWCHKCQGLYFAGNQTQGACPAGGMHENQGSGDYTLLHNVQSPSSPTDGCWVVFYEHDNFQRGKIRFDGPFDVRRMDDHRLDNGKSAGDEIDSLRTGPNAWLEVYEDENFEDTLRRFGPNSEITKLDDHDIGDNIDSFALFDSQPPWWFSVPGIYTKRVEPGDWRTLEWTFNQPVALGIVGPAGARIKVSYWLASSEEKVLDGINRVVITTSFGKIQILVNESTYVTYGWGPTGDPKTLPPIPVPLP